MTAAVQAMRELALYKPPGVAETIDWTESLVLLGHRALDAKVAEETLGVVLKYREDADLVRREGLPATRDHESDAYASKGREA